MRRQPTRRTKLNLGSNRVLHATTTNRDQALSGPAIRLRASRYSKIVAEMQVSKPGEAQLFWGSSSQPSPSEATSVTVPTIGDGQFHSYIFEVGKNEHWGGCVTSLRFDPCSETAVHVAIRSIRIE